MNDRPGRTLVTSLVVSLRWQDSGEQTRPWDALHAMKGAVMTDTLSVLVQLDLHGASVRLIVTGTVTETTQRAVHPLLARTCTIVAGATVSVDLTGAEHVEPAAFELLQGACDHHRPEAVEGPVEILAPAAGRSGPPRPGGPAMLDTGSRYHRFHHPRAFQGAQVPHRQLSRR